MYIQYISVSKKIYYEKLTGIKNYLRFTENETSLTLKNSYT